MMMNCRAEVRPAGQTPCRAEARPAGQKPAPLRGKVAKRRSAAVKREKEEEQREQKEEEQREQKEGRPRCLSEFCQFERGRRAHRGDADLPEKGSGRLAPGLAQREWSEKLRRVGLDVKVRKRPLP